MVPREYQVTIFTTTSGRTISGLVKEESDLAVTIRAKNEIVILPKNEIDQRTASRLSMMPEGVLEQMSIEEARALRRVFGPIDAPGKEIIEMFITATRRCRSTKCVVPKMSLSV